MRLSSEAVSLGRLRALDLASKAWDACDDSACSETEIAVKTELWQQGLAPEAPAEAAGCTGGASCGYYAPGTCTVRTGRAPGPRAVGGASCKAALCSPAPADVQQIDVLALDAPAPLLHPLPWRAGVRSPRMSRCSMLTPSMLPHCRCALKAPRGRQRCGPPSHTSSLQRQSRLR